MEKTISHIFLDAGKRPESWLALRYSEQGKWKDISWPQYFTYAENLGCCLASLGVKRGDRVAIMSNTRYQWPIADMAILGIGAVTVPVYQNNTIQDVEFILNNSGVVAVFLEDENQYKKIQQLEGKLPTVKSLISFTNIPNSFGVINWTQAQKKGEDFKDSQKDFFTSETGKNKLDDIATIVYTSGTTGQPKGAVLCHSCIASECEDLKSVLDVNETDRTLTFLPFAHIFGRIESFGQIYFGWQMVFAESIDRIAANLPEVQPTFMLAVPRVFEKIYARILSQVDEGGSAKKKIFDWAVKLGSEISRSKRENRMPSLATLIQYKIAFKLVFSKLHQRMGGRMRFLISGSAPLSKEIIEFFHAAGILILEGYGLTESTAGIFFNSPYKYVFGTVGQPIGDVKVKIAEDGEILVKSKKIFREYYKNPEATKEAFTADGWFCTGDIGEVDAQGFLKITDRKKDMLKTAGGKMIAPQKLENMIKLNKLISQVAIYGDKQKYLVALITLNPEELQSFAKSHGITDTNYSALSQNPQVIEAVREIIKEKNSQLASFETIKNFKILTDDFSIDRGELTPSMKIKRKYISQKYGDVIQGLYS